MQRAVCGNAARTVPPRGGGGDLSVYSIEVHVDRVTMVDGTCTDGPVESMKDVSMKKVMIQQTVIERLVDEYPVLYLYPDTTPQSEYRRVFLRGEEPAQKSLSHYQGDNADRMESVMTPEGAVLVVTLGNRRDFELILRGLMAVKNGPLDQIPQSQGAAMLTVFNWPRIHAHLALYPANERNAEFQRFTLVKENYMDMLVVLSRGPYSNVSAAQMGCTQEDWMNLSDTIRRYHELTHVICRRRCPKKADPVRDELIADAVGLYAAYGFFDPEMEKLFLGIQGETYTGGRLENYTDKPGQITPAICRELVSMKQKIVRCKASDPFELIPVLIN